MTRNRPTPDIQIRNTQWRPTDELVPNPPPPPPPPSKDSESEDEDRESR